MQPPRYPNLPVNIVTVVVVMLAALLLAYGVDLTLR